MSDLYSYNNVMRLVGHNNISAEGKYTIMDIAEAHEHYNQTNPLYVAHSAYIAGTIDGKRQERRRRKYGKTILKEEILLTKKILKLYRFLTSEKDNQIREGTLSALQNFALDSSEPVKKYVADFIHAVNNEVNRRQH